MPKEIEKQKKETISNQLVCFFKKKALMTCAAYRFQLKSVF